MLACIRRVRRSFTFFVLKATKHSSLPRTAYLLSATEFENHLLRNTLVMRSGSESRLCCQDQLTFSRENSFRCWKPQSAAGFLHDGYGFSSRPKAQTRRDLACNRAATCVASKFYYLCANPNGFEAQLQNLLHTCTSSVKHQVLHLNLQQTNLFHKRTVAILKFKNVLHKL